MSTTTTATASATTSAAAKHTRKLCSHAINTGGCRLGDACPNVHPADVEAAKTEFLNKKTLNICVFHPNCVRSGCVFLHATPAPKATSTPSTPPTRAPPAGKTPPRTTATAPSDKPARAAGGAAAKPRAARSGEPKSPAPPGGRGGAKARARKAPAQKEAARAEPESLRVLHRIRGKINALERTRLAYASIAKDLGSVEAQGKADMAQEMQAAILDQLALFAGSIDEYLLALGATSDPSDETPSDEELPASDGDELPPEESSSA